MSGGRLEMAEKIKAKIEAINLKIANYPSWGAAMTAYLEELKHLNNELASLVQSKESCETCRFYKMEWDACLRHAPRVYPNAHSNLQQWPSVNKLMWCGEYEEGEQ